MANAKVSKIYCEYATVDTAPAIGSGGYWTNIVYPRRNEIKKLFFSIRDTADDSSPSVMTVKLQFKCAGDSGWADYLDFAGSTLAIGNRMIIDECGEGVAWRAGVEDDLNYTSGSCTFGFDW